MEEYLSSTMTIKLYLRNQGNIIDKNEADTSQ